MTSLVSNIPWPASVARHTAHLGERGCALGEHVYAEAAAAASSKSSEVVDGTVQLTASDFFFGLIVSSLLKDLKMSGYDCGIVCNPFQLKVGFVLCASKLSYYTPAHLR